MIRLRHTDQWVGLLVVAAVVVFVGAVLEAGVLRPWFRPPGHLRIVLPPAGVGGLADGADVQVLGTHAGTIRSVVLNPNQQIYAEADIDRQAEPFIRRDSKAVIRRSFGVAGAAYVDISRGTGPPLDWSYAVINATTEVSPTDTLTSMLNQVQQTVTPVLADTKRALDALTELIVGLQKGQGTVGQLLTKNTLAQQAEQAAATLNDAAKQIDALTQAAASEQQGAPELLRRMNVMLGNLEAVTRELARAAPTLPAITHNAAGATASLPALLTQTQVTLAELQRLMTQLRSSWLLGGGPVPPQPTRLSPSQIHP